jgi:predicted ATPase/transcriptional regulator with XRE-family HTH domain
MPPNSPTTLTLRDWLKQRRKALGLNNKHIAAALGISKDTYESYANGRRPIAEDVAHKLCEVVQLPTYQHALFVALATGRIATVSTQDLLPPKPTYPGQLPHLSNPFFGRQADLTKLHNLFNNINNTRTRLVTLVGPPGVGKTRLATEAAQSLHTRWADGVCFVDLTAVSQATDVATAVSLALGLTPAKTNTSPHPVVEFLRPRTMLLLLDNFEHVLSAARLVADWLAACPNLHVLATSRAKLGLRAERVVMLEPLPLPNASQPLTPSRLNEAPATAFFVDRACAQRVNFAEQLDNIQANDIAHICAKLDGLPLAIELTAAHCDTLSMAALLSQIENGSPLPPAPLQDLDPRQRTLQNAIAWSYDLLKPEQQHSFAKLGVFVGGFDEAAACALGIDPKHLQTLHRYSLIQQIRPAHFRLLETLREFSLGQLQTSGHEADMRSALATYFAQMMAEHARNNTADSSQTVLHLSFHLDNLRNTLRWLLQIQDLRRALLLASSLFVLWLNKGLFREGLTWIEQALPQTPDPDEADHNLQDLATAFYRAGFLASQIGDAHSQHHFAQAETLYEKLGDKYGLGRMLSARGMMARYPGNRRIAENYLKHSLSLLQGTQPVNGLMFTLNQLGRLHLEVTGDGANAENYFAQALQLAQSISATRSVLGAQCSIGFARLLQSNWAGAQAIFEAVCAHNTPDRDATTLAEAQLGLAYLAERRGDFSQAQHLCEEALVTYRRQNLTYAVYPTLCQQGRIAYKQHNLAAAQQQFGEALHLAARSLGIETVAQSLAGLACVAATQQAQPEQAACQLGAALAIESVFALAPNAERAQLISHTQNLCVAKLGQFRFHALLSSTRNAVQAKISQVEFEDAHQALAAIPLQDTLADLNLLPNSPSP